MRAAEIVERLRAYNGRKDAQHSAVPLSHIIDVCTTLLQHEFLHTNVQLVVELPAEPLPDLWVDATQIELVFVSLFRNGMESFPNLPKNERLMLVTARKLQNSQIEVAIQDGGRGLSSLDPELMFQPFSSTKKHGLGMGLPVSRSIVELHGGQIWAEPDPQGGSCFRFTLPTINPRGV